MSDSTLLDPAVREATAPEAPAGGVLEVIPENPFSTEEARTLRAGANMYGAFSIETFCKAGALSFTHDDAQGFYDYVKQFTPPNFWYRDAGVKIWAYYEQYDNWQDTYGMDAARAVYHSGHGGMDANGVFYVPMGAAWAGNDCTATSNNMRLGNEHARYVFWSTCLSCRVLDGHSPIRTWSPANLGLRMLFGFETVSVDDPNYGKYFFQEWNKNKSFSQAWLDASWRISHNQAPSVFACGSSADDAKNRVFNERLFYGGAVSTNWYWWRWYNAAREARSLPRQMPQSLLVARLQPAEARLQSAWTLANRFGLELPTVDVPRRADGSFRVARGDQRMSQNPDGSIDVQIDKPNIENLAALSREAAIELARDAIGRFGLDRNVSLVQDRVIESLEAGGSAQGSGRMEGPFTTASIVQFRQTINGLPVLNPDQGNVRVEVDNDGKVTRVSSSLFPVDNLVERGATEAPSPPPPGRLLIAEEGPEPTGIEQRLVGEFRNRMAARGMSGQNPLQGYAIVPGTAEVGYEIRGNEAIVVARALVEVDFGNGYRKQYWVSQPLS